MNDVIKEEVELLKKRVAMLEQQVTRAADLCTETQGEVRTMQKNLAVGFAAVAERQRNQDEVLEVIRRKVVGG